MVQRSIESPPVKRNELPRKMWETIAIDLMSPLLTRENLFVNYYSRYIEVAILKSISAKAIRNELFRIFAKYGFPKTIICDNGR